MFGPGTMISIPIVYAEELKRLPTTSWNGWGIDPEDRLSLDTLETSGLSADIPFRDINLKSTKPDVDYSINLTETSIITLGKDDILTLSGDFKDKDSQGICHTDSYTLGFNSSWYPLFNSKISYSQKLEEEDKTEEDKILPSNFGVFIKTEYQISSNPTTVGNYSLLNDKDTCYITEGIEYNTDGSITTDELGEVLEISSNIDLTGLSSTSVDISEKLNLKLMTYKLSPVKYIVESGENKGEYLYPDEPNKNKKIDSHSSADYKEYEEITFSSNYNNGSSFRIEIPFFFNRGNVSPEEIIIDEDNSDLTPDPHNNYIIPILLSGDYNKIANQLEAEIYIDSDLNNPVKINQFGNGDSGDYFIFNKNQNFYQLTFEAGDNIKNSTGLILRLSYFPSVEELENDLKSILDKASTLRQVQSIGIDLDDSDLDDSDMI